MLRTRELNPKLRVPFQPEGAAPAVWASVIFVETMSVLTQRTDWIFVSEKLDSASEEYRNPRFRILLAVNEDPLR